MVTELRRIIHFAKASRRNRMIAAFLHVAMWPLLLIPRLIWPLRSRRGAIQKILLIRVDGIGDLAMCAAIFPSLRKKFPKAQIDLLTSENAAPVADLFVAEGWLNNVWRMPLKGRGLKPYRKLAKDFRKLRYDAGIDLRGDMRNLLLMWLAGIPRRLGLRGSGLSYLATALVELPVDAHQSAESAELVRRLGVEEMEPWPRLPLQASHIAEADRWLAENGVAADRPICAMHLGAFYPVKEWPLERFAAVAKKLHERTGAQIVAIGGPPEAELGKALAAQVRFPVALAAGRTSLVLTAAIVSRCDVFIGADSGPAHVAAGVGCAVVVLFGPAIVQKYQPRSPRVTVMAPVGQCDPLCDQVCARPVESRCMMQHNVEAVAAKAEGFILVSARHQSGVRL